MNQVPQTTLNKDLYFLERTPRSGDIKNAPVVILLHGRAAKAETIFSIEGLLDPSFHIIAIEAPYNSSRGEYEWFLPYDYDHPLESFSEEHFKESEDRLTQQILRMVEEQSISSDRLFIGGFSQGAAMSHILAFRGAVKPRGIIAMSGFFPRPLMQWNMPSTIPDFFISHGTRDTILPVSESIFAQQFIERTSAMVDYYEYNGRHKMTIPLIEKINQWVQDKCSIV